MKKSDLNLITHLILQVILFIPIIPFFKYHQQIDIGIFIIILLGIINFISYIITVLNYKNSFILKHSTLMIAFIIFICMEDSILIKLQIGKHIELFIYSLLLLENLDLIFSIKKITYIRILTIITTVISALTVNYNYYFSNLLYNYIVIMLFMSPCITYLLDKNIRKYHFNEMIFLQICFVSSYLIFIKFNNIEDVSVSEYLLLSLISTELVLLYRIINTDIKKRILLFSNAMKKLFFSYFVLFIMLLLIGIPIELTILLYLYYFIFISELLCYRKYKKYQRITFYEIIDKYYYDENRNMELERLNILRIQTFLHDDILQIIIAIRRWIEDNLSGSGKQYIIQNLDKLNDLIRHEIDSFNPKLKDYKSLYDAYNRLIKDLEDMYLSREIFIEFECDKSIELPAPYDELIYKCMNELLINAFKHSKGYNTNIVLKVEKSMVYLTITNVGDYVDDENKIKDGNIGLNILRFNLKDYNGDFEYKIFKNNEEFEESYVQFKINIPLDRSVINENFVNRRS